VAHGNAGLEQFGLEREVAAHEEGDEVVAPQVGDVGELLDPPGPRRGPGLRT
jgi:hypothetical protein